MLLGLIAGTAARVKLDRPIADAKMTECWPEQVSWTEMLGLALVR
jgi:hypothetical protein